MDPSVLFCLKIRSVLSWTAAHLFFKTTVEGGKVLKAMFMGKASQIFGCWKVLAQSSNSMVSQETGEAHADAFFEASTEMCRVKPGDLSDTFEVERGG